MECYLQVYRQLVALDWPVSYGRTNVTPLGAESSGLHTMSVGLLVLNDGEVRLSANFPCFRRLAQSVNQLLRLLDDVFELPGVPWTALQLNKNYASRMHVDSRNVGTSIILALGSWNTGGRLWLHDRHGRDVMEAPNALRGTHFQEGDQIPGTLTMCVRLWSFQELCPTPLSRMTAAPASALSPFPRCPIMATAALRLTLGAP